MRHWLIYLLVIFVIPNSSFGQRIETTSVLFNGRELPTQIIGFTQDDRGYIWMVDIQFGMFRYDGTHLVRFGAQVGNPNTLSSNRTECITTDGNNIWVGTFSHGLNRYDPDSETYTHYRHDPDDPTSIRSDEIRTLAFDKDGMLWIGTLTGVDKLNPSTGEFTHIHTEDSDEELLRNEHIRAMFIDSDGIIWVGSSSPFPNEQTKGGLFRIDIEEGDIEYFDSRKNDPNSLTDSKVRAIFEDSRGTLWIGTSGDGLHTMDRASMKITRHTYDPKSPSGLSRPPLNTSTFDHITFINEDNAGNIWIGTFAGGLAKYSYDTDQTEYFNTELADSYYISNNTFWSSLKSRDGLLWVSAWTPLDESEFVFKINGRPNKINFYSLDRSSLPTVGLAATRELNRINAFNEDDEGNVYLAAIDGIWRETENNNFEKVFLIEGLAGSSEAGARNVEFDAQGNIWSATIRGIYKYNRQDDKFTLLTHDADDESTISHNNVQRLQYIGNNQLLATGDGGLDLVNTQNLTVRRITTEIEGKTERFDFVPRLLHDSKQRTWLGTRSQGLIAMDLETGIGRRYHLGSGTPYIYYIFEDSRGNIWVSTQAEGVYKYNSEQDRFILVKDKRGYLDEVTTVWSITEDFDHNIWVTPIGGLVKLDPNSLSSTLYGSTWGVNTSLSTDQPFVTSEGEILTGARNGYYRLQPRQLKNTMLDVPNPFISNILLDDQKIDIAQRNDILNSPNPSLYLRHDQNDISLEVNHIDFISTSTDRRLQYQLDGNETIWRDTRTGDMISYYNLRPGDYKFRLRASDINGNWGESALDILIAKPWWREWWAYVLYAIIFGIGVWRVHVYQKERTISQERERIKDRELEQAKEIEKAYTTLKTTQEQLVHAEKMASLGELTAGIAHEIKNPLNFVNNFSEVNVELIEELAEEIKNGDSEEVQDLLNDIKSNEEKIQHHGQRADSIVKGMLMHSKNSNDEKVPTDINALADEYLRLAYHGLRAKDKNFNANLNTDFDESIKDVDVNPQDFGRVLLNLITNAFHACMDKQKIAENGYAPEVGITTSQSEHSIEVKISDNGKGIPEEVKGKIFQPFFTTKPTGEGTGLGLSMAFDIITKAHRGSLEVDSEEGKGSTFTIRLPYS